ncbi:MAG: aspartate--tRNA(Asn) ligase [Verrucomicrobia bacterium]|nr:aspartate--tRNA(Asn) ligase [Verrucomicrobiota bacterium]MDE3047346.1 aspartate--tRNA(Asn) ligase [Verrucomicrobiota bacterium]
MHRTLAKEVPHSIGKHVYVRGWLNNVRAMGKLAFLLLRDRTGLIQVVIEDKGEIQKVSHLQPGSVIGVHGRIVASNAVYKAEVVDPKIEVENPIHEVPPLEYYKPELHTDLEFILDHRPIALRSRQLAAIFKIQAEIAHAYQLYMHDTVGAVEYFAPNIIGASSEGGAEFFNVDYFGYTATLAQSSQLYKQIMVGVHERVFALMPFFRAEPSHTTRHLSEGKQFEFEMGFFEKWEEIMDVQEGCLKFIVKSIHERCKPELEALNHQIIQAPEHIPFPRLTFAEAQELYFQRTKIDERNEPDLSPAAERELCAWAQEKHGTDLIFITDWKTEKRPFYAYPKEDAPHLTNTFDLLCAGTEITSGGQRRHTYDSMVQGILMKGMDPNNFADYLSIFKYGMPAHGGFGMGLERLTMTLLKLKNIREVSLFPSDTKRIAGNRIKARIFFGGENIRNEIIHQIKAKRFDFDHQVHEATPTSEDAARVRNVQMAEGVKALILRGKTTKKNYQFNIPAHLKVDMKAVAEMVGEKCEFEDPAVIQERFGLQVGGVPPFGNLLNLDNYYDEEILKQERAAFNCGLLTESIIMKSKDLFALVDPKVGKFSK